ncbi:MAG TPA: hypothetical protein PLK06_03305 [bacterium]|nr:hypothetical protein [bacterium]
MEYQDLQEMRDRAHDATNGHMKPVDDRKRSRPGGVFFRPIVTTIGLDLEDREDGDDA